MARNNRKQAVSYSVLIPNIWQHNLGFGEPIQSYSSFSNEPKTVVVRGVETSRVNSISRGGDLRKSGPVPRAKADALKNARKIGGGSIFVQGFNLQRQYGSRPIKKPLSCRNTVKINQEQFNGNQNPGGSSSSMETMCKRLSQEYVEYQQKFNSSPVSKRFDTKNYDQEKFKELAKDPRANKEVFHKTTCDEARTAFQSEMEGIVDNPQRIENLIQLEIFIKTSIKNRKPYVFSNFFLFSINGKIKFKSWSEVQDL